MVLQFHEGEGLKMERVRVEKFGKQMFGPHGMGPPPFSDNADCRSIKRDLTMQGLGCTILPFSLLGMGDKTRRRMLVRLVQSEKVG